MPLVSSVSETSVRGLARDRALRCWRIMGVAALHGQITGAKELQSAKGKFPDSWF